MKYRIKLLLAIILGAISIMADTFYNGYPLFYSDSHIYMLSGFQFRFPNEEPVAYGLLIRLFSLNGLSLWPVVFIQSLLLSYLIFQVVKCISGEQRLIVKGLAIVIFLSLCTGLSWSASSVMTDIYTPIAILSVFLIVFGDMGRAKRILLYTVFFISAATHMSHIILFSSLFVCILLGRNYIWPQIERKSKTVRVSILLGLTLCAEIPMASTFSDTKYVIFMGAMVEQGIAKKYLDEYCGSRNYMLCKYKDSLPDNGQVFMWSAKSPLYKMGGRIPQVIKEFKEITVGTLTQPKYIGWHVLGSLGVTLKQLYTFDICDGNWSFTDTNGAVCSVIHKYFKGEEKAYFNSRQIGEKFIGISIMNIVYRWIEGISILSILVLVLFYREVFKGIYKTFVIFIGAAILLNAWALSTFDTVVDRFGCKVMWLIPFLAILCLMRLMDARKPDVKI